jgi:hypothetical protein
MTASQHIAEAERLVSKTHGYCSDPERNSYLAAAQVHATLALAAATAGLAAATGPQHDGGDR